jgi:hypothetical protein
MEEVSQSEIRNPKSAIVSGGYSVPGERGQPPPPPSLPLSGRYLLGDNTHYYTKQKLTNQLTRLPDYKTTRLPDYETHMKQAILILTALAALLLLAITASLSLSADSFIAAYLEVEQQPESVSDIVLRSRTTASAPDPHRQNGMWFGAGLLAVVLVFIASLLALMFGGGTLLRQWRLAFKRPRRHAGRPTPLPAATRPACRPRPTKASPCCPCAAPRAPNNCPPGATMASDFAIVVTRRNTEETRRGAERAEKGNPLRVLRDSSVPLRVPPPPER